MLLGPGDDRGIAIEFVGSNDSDAIRQSGLEAADRVSLFDTETVGEVGERRQVGKLDLDPARGALRHPAGRAVIGNLAVDQLNVLRQRSAALGEDRDLGPAIGHAPSSSKARG
jgi:hypothetical protein